MQKKIAIIGAGLSGLAIAIRLKLKGYHVIVFEKNKTAGGKMGEINEKGFRFDTGPSLFTLPDLVDEIIYLSNNNVDFEYFNLDNICRYFYNDGTIINSYADEKRFYKELHSKINEPESTINTYLKRVKNLYNLTAHIFIFNSFHKLKNYLKPEYKKTLLQLHKLKPFTSLHQLNRKKLKSDKLVQLFDRYATYNGSNPYKAPSTLSVIAHLEHNIGAFFPKNGMYSIINTLYKTAKKLNIEFEFNNEVSNIYKAENNFVIENSEGNYISDYCISAIDAGTFYNKIWKNGKNKSKKWNKNLSTSAIIFYWGMKIKSEKLDLHNILFAENYKNEFENLFKLKKLYEDPTIYIFISSKVVKSDAPENHENWFVMINAPAGLNISEEKVLNIRKNIINKINRVLSMNIENNIVFEKVATPETIEINTGSLHGALYGKNSNSAMSAFLRHPNFSLKTKKLYFVGGSVHPGGGIPLCLASAKIVSNEFINCKK